MSEVVKLDKAKRKCNTAPRYSYMAIDQTSGAGRYYNRMVRDIENDLGGRRHRIQLEFVRAFSGAATRLKSLTHAAGTVAVGGFLRHGRTLH